LICLGAILLVSAISTAFVSFTWTNLNVGAHDAAVQKCASVDDPSHPMSHFYTAYKESYGILNDITNPKLDTDERACKKSAKSFAS
jgi:hypothetical protein